MELDFHLADLTTVNGLCLVFLVFSGYVVHAN